MDFVIIIAAFFYMLSTTGYFIYFFLQKDYLQKTGYYLLAAGFTFHFIFLISGFMKSGIIPAYNLRETLLLSGWSIAGIFLVLQYRFRLKVLGVYAAPLVMLVVIFACCLPYEPSKTDNLLNNLWLIAHVITIFLGESSFALACGVGVLYLLQEHAIKTKNHRFFFKRLPSLELLDSTGYACIVIGFTLVTIGLATGLVYAKAVWGRFWSWDPKEVWSGITWLLYAALLHERLTAGWRGKKAAIMAIIGFVIILFTFFGVNFFLDGHHGEFTRW